MGKSVNVLGKKYTIQYVNAVEIDDNPVYGYCDCGNQKIVIDKNTHGKTQEDVLIHEIMHAVIERTGAHNNFTEDQIETICDLAPLLIQAMRGIK